MKKLLLITIILLSFSGIAQNRKFDFKLEQKKQKNKGAIAFCAFYTANFIVAEYALRTKNVTLYNANRNVFLGSLPVTAAYATVKFEFKKVHGKKKLKLYWR